MLIRTHFSVFSSRSHFDIFVNSATFSCGKNWHRLSTCMCNFFINSLIYLEKRFSKMLDDYIFTKKVFTAASVVDFPFSAHLLAFCLWIVRFTIQLDPFSALYLYEKENFINLHRNFNLIYNSISMEPFSWPVFT